jgi:ubiquitin carboxyl-terminal hydrolase L3
LKRWFPLESNPDVMNAYIEQLGYPIDSYRFVDVLATEEWAFDMVPQPVLGVVMLFPIKELTEKHKEEEQAGIEENGQDLSENVYFMKQIVGNACGTIGLFHSIGNSQSSVELTGYLKKFFEDTAEMTAMERATELEKSDEIEVAHEAGAQEGQSEVIQDVNTHFIAFTTVDGGLYELDGRKAQPIRHGDSSPETLLPDACRVIKEFMARDEGEMRFTILALAKNMD